ncbi:protein EARLY FLOWERING 3-like [Gossypium arboreum]|uniref:protein EARLY FLOWERING 3-like n=1 Tax=Gossypium arboreum TaxID=29729 RepID=UPI0022F175DD|nr:protein EARLY FLOWERING 3-like [Gossypium arboreum]
MRGGNDEMSPMFPRLHVNDTNKGPKAPSRNKMALYEQLNVPSQRFNSGSLSMLPLPPNNNNNSLVPLISSNHIFSSRKLGFNDYLMVPATAVSGIDQNCSCSQQSKGRGSFSKLNLSSLMQLHIVDEKTMKGSDSVDSDSRSSIDILNSEDGLDARLHNVYMDAQNDLIFRENILVEAGKCLESASKVGSDSCLRESPEVDNGSSNVLENRSQTPGEKKCGVISRHKNARGASMVESISPFDISPDDIVGIIGEKNFWKVRRAIDNQQGVFTMQVFELHRLIKISGLIAGSPHMLLEDTLHMAKPSLDVSSIKKSPSNYVPKQPFFLKNSSQKTNISIKRGNDDAVANLTLPSAIDDTNQRVVPRQPKIHALFRKSIVNSDGDKYLDISLFLSNWKSMHDNAYRRLICKVAATLQSISNPRFHKVGRQFE